MLSTQDMGAGSSGTHPCARHPSRGSPGQASSCAGPWSCWPSRAGGLKAGALRRHRCSQGWRGSLQEVTIHLGQNRINRGPELHSQ